MAKSWFQILEIVKKISQNGSKQFSSDDLAAAAGFKATEPSEIKRGAKKGQMGKGSTPQKIASGWLSKFRKWGYVMVMEQLASAGPMPSNVYTLTKKGLECEMREGVELRLTRLIEAVQAFRDLRGRPAEGQAWKDLLKTLNEVEK